MSDPSVILSDEPLRFQSVQESLSLLTTLLQFPNCSLSERQSLIRSACLRLSWFLQTQPIPLSFREELQTLSNALQKDLSLSRASQILSSFQSQIQ